MSLRALAVSLALPKVSFGFPVERAGGARVREECAGGREVRGPSVLSILPMRDCRPLSRGLLGPECRERGSRDSCSDARGGVIMRMEPEWVVKWVPSSIVVPLVYTLAL